MVCPQCAAGHLKEADALEGRVEALHGLPTYITEPTQDQSPKGMIVIVPDGLGWDLPNTRILADTYARRTGCRVYVPDLQAGHAIPHFLLHGDYTPTEHPSPLMLADMNYLLLGKAKPWLELPWVMLLWARAIFYFAVFAFRQRQSVASQRVLAWFRAFRTHTAPTAPVLAAGFCWGGLYAVRLCHDDARTAAGAPLVDAAFAAHPSSLEVPRDAERCRRPLSVCLGDADVALAAPQARRVKAILEGRDEARFEVVILPGALHGFAIRGAIDDPKQVEYSQVAEDQAVAWFNRWLREGALAAGE